MQALCKLPRCSSQAGYCCVAAVRTQEGQHCQTLRMSLKETWSCQWSSWRGEQRLCIMEAAEAAEHSHCASSCKQLLPLPCCHCCLWAVHTLLEC